MPPVQQIVTVKLTKESYDIRVQPGLLTNVGIEIFALCNPSRVFIVTDTTVGPLHAQSVVDSVRRAGADASVVQIAAGESGKTLATVSNIYDALLEQRIERSNVVIALGGGVVGDLTGFAAATVLRGVPFFQIPTTLLSMVDASVGGKTGFNHAAGKNLIGAFYHPKIVLIDPETLRTLPADTLSEGLAECIKHCVIRDPEGFASLEQNMHKAKSLDMDYLTAFIARNVNIKARVVEADPTERGERAHLNYGHTFGHAIEKVSHFRVSHGAAVALGMSAANHVAVENGLLDRSDAERIGNLISAAGLPTADHGHLNIDELVDAMKSDKKVERGSIRLILPHGIGRAVIRNGISVDQIRAGLETVCH